MLAAGSTDTPEALGLEVPMSGRWAGEARVLGFESLEQKITHADADLGG